MTRKTLNIAIAAALLGSLALVGCKKNADETAVTPPPVTTEPAAMPEPTPAPAAAATTVTSVDLGNAIGADMKVATPATTFAPKDTIYASVATTGDEMAAAPGKLTARWTFQDGQVVSEESKDFTFAGAGNTEFHIAKPDGFPAGAYKVEISLDGNVVQSKDFTVK